MSDTPRTDAECRVGLDGCTNITKVDAAFAQTLERELTAMTAARDKALEALKGQHEYCIELLNDTWRGDHSEQLCSVCDLIKELETIS